MHTPVFINHTLKEPLKGRGANSRPPNRFENFHTEKYADNADDFEPPGPSAATQIIRETARSIISYNDSPDVGLEATLNPYRGCEHGCIYCYARPTHEYLGFSCGLDFETKIVVKENAPELLRKTLSSPRWQPKVVGLSGITDCYQPIERKLQITRKCLEVFTGFLNPVVIITKNYLVTRDIDLLEKLAQNHAVGVLISVTTLDAKLAQRMEPRTSQPQRRLEAIRLLSGAKIPVGVNVAPVIPGLTDYQIPSILSAAKAAGAQFAGYTVLRLPYGVAGLFEEWLSRHFPERKQKILNRIRSIREGKLNDPNFHSRMEGKGIYADEIAQVFSLWHRRLGLSEGGPRLSTESFRRPHLRQMELFAGADQAGLIDAGDP